MAVDPAKDVDGLHPVNLGRLVIGSPGPLPCTPAGIVELLHAYDVPVEGRHVVIIGRGLTIGRPLALLLALKRPGCNAAVTVVHTGVATSDWPAWCGRPTSWWRRPAGPALVTPDMVKPGAAVCRAGTSWEGKKLISDVHDDVAEVAGWITPRLGGVGPMTRAMLLRNAVRAAERRPGERRAARATRQRRHQGEADQVSEREYSERPWGNYTVLDDDAPDHKVKRIVVHPGKRLSYQRHAKRAEHWFIVAGTAQVTLDGRVIEVAAGRVHRHPAGGGAPHRQRRATPTSCFIEVQHGTYFGEDDIVRLEDDFGRVDEATRPGRPAVTRIAELLDAGPTYSFEFFPPKNDTELTTLARTIGELQPLEPSFVSVTYRGGAESRQRTFDLVIGHAAHDVAQPDGPPHLRGPLPAGAGRHLGRAAQGGRREPDGAGRRSADGPRRGPGRAGLRHRAGRAGPGHRRVLHRRGGPSGRPPALGRHAERPGLPGRQAGAGRLRRDPVLLRGVRVRGAGGRPAPTRRRDARAARASCPSPRSRTMGRLGAMGAAAPDWMQERLRAADERGGADAVRKEGVELATELCARPPRVRRAGAALLHLQHLERDPRDLRGAGAGAQRNS